MKAGFKAILIIFLSLFLLSSPITLANQDSGNPSFEEWLKTPLGLKAMSFTKTLFLADTIYYQPLTPEQTEAIKKIQGESLSEIVGVLDKHSRYHGVEEWEEIKESLEGKFEGVGLRLSIPDLSKLQEKLMAIVREKIPSLNSEILNPEFIKAVYKWITEINPEAKKLYDRITQGIIPESGLLIDGVIAKGPAEKSGIKKGWLIIKIDDKKIEGMAMKDAVKLIKGPSGTKVRLTLVPPKSERIRTPIEAEITRGVIQTSIISSARMLNGETGYIRFTDFYEGVDKDFKNNVAFLKSRGMKSLIIDLRDNPGGLLHMAHRILEVLVPAGRIAIYAKYRDSNLEPYWSLPENVIPKVFSGKIAVLINENSASASELVTISLKEQIGAVVIGQKSYGKASIQVIKALPDGSGLRLTIGHYLSPVSGEDIHAKGVIPDIEISDDPDTPEDEVILKAIKKLNK